MIRVLYEGPPHPVFGLVSMLEDESFEVDFDKPDMGGGPAHVQLSVIDAQSKGVAGVEAVASTFKERHPDLPVTIRVEPDE
jgi:hypothetical protein